MSLVDQPSLPNSTKEW